MVHKARPEASDAQLAWDRFTVLHEAEPAEMEFLDGEDTWRFRYLDSTESGAEVRLGAAGLEAVGSPDPDKLLRIKATWERAARVREQAGKPPGWVDYLWFGNATIWGALAIWMCISVLGSHRSSHVWFTLFFLAMGWIIVAVQHLGGHWSKRVPPRWTGAYIFFMFAFSVWNLLSDNSLR